ncbi:hypothetical protein PR202_gb23705 [Eleusine coracana subsp. coracana]|uniref:Uncharacterized protein n=1 Tax=Eleusine coracana subsp. coracana TaxID=191504 RepID=A0AAV5FJF9_ELECO|nr:hypothetical protein PR202_gb23705 [Eleusine coracana subsp. coracana]
MLGLDLTGILLRIDPVPSKQTPAWIWKSAKFQKNIMKRGSVPETTIKKGNDYPVGPLVLGFFIFVVIGSLEYQEFETKLDAGILHRSSLCDELMIFEVLMYDF